MDTLSVAFNDVVRKWFTITRDISISSIYVENNVNSRKTLLRKAAYNFGVRPTKSGNRCVNAVAQYSFTVSPFLWDKDIFI